MARPYRYPGALPFTSDQKDLFFGRDDEIKALYGRIRFEPVVVLYSKSGLGKSSLINAGLIPIVQRENRFVPITIRFGAWTSDRTDTPVGITRSQIGKDGYDRPNFLEKIISSEQSLWQSLKSRQILGEEQEFLLLFDQFEELFTYPAAQVDAFKNQLAELLRTEIPQRYRKMLDLYTAVGRELLNQEEDILFHRQPIIRILLAIRSDRMHLLNRLSDQLPTILVNHFELKALDESGARTAITAPAHAAGTYATPTFDYEPAAIDKVISFLQDDDRLIETIQLQILCKTFEDLVERQGITNLTADNIGDLARIIANYYHDKIDSLPTAAKREAACRLIEDGLILPGEKERLSLHEGHILSFFKVDKGLLQQLVNVHLLRAEPSPHGGYLYELSHDSLVDPVLEARAKRKAREAAAAERAKRHRAGRAVIIAVLIALLSVALAINFKVQRDAVKSALANEEEAVRNAEAAEALAEERRKAAEKAEQEARKSAKEAAEQRDSADWQRNIAENALRDRILALDKLQEFTDSLQMSKDSLLVAQDKLVNEQIKLKEANTEAVEQATRANENEMKAEQYRKQVLSKAIALSSIRLNTIDPELKALLAKQAYNFNQSTNSDTVLPIFPEVHQGLYYGAKALGGTAFFPGAKVLVSGHSRFLGTATNGSALYALDKNGQLIRWETAGKDDFGQLQLASNYLASSVPPGTAMALDPDQEVVAYFTSNQGIRLDPISTRNGEKQTYPVQNLRVKDILFGQPDDIYFTAARGLYRQNLKSNSAPVMLQQFPGTITAVAKMDALLFIGTSDGQLFQYDPEKAEQLLLLSLGQSHISTLATVRTAASLRVAIGLKNGNVHLYRWENDKLIEEQSYNQHDGFIASLRFNRKGDLLAIASYDHSVSLIYLERLEPYNILTFDDLGDWAIDVDFLAQDQFLIANNRVGELRIYNLHMEEYAEAICRKINRDIYLTTQEWNQFIGPQDTIQPTCH